MEKRAEWREKGQPKLVYFKAGLTVEQALAQRAVNPRFHERDDMCRLFLGENGATEHSDGIGAEALARLGRHREARPKRQCQPMQRQKLSQRTFPRC